jgi:hypothetical protein
MTRTGAFLIGLLLLASAGCTRRDWVGDLAAYTPSADLRLLD